MAARGEIGSGRALGDVAERFPGVAAASLRVAERFPGVAERSPDIADRSPNVAERSPDIADRSPNVAERSPDIADRFSLGLLSSRRRCSAESENK